MSAPTLPQFAAPQTATRLRSARVQFCDRDDAEMFLEWLHARAASYARADETAEVTFPVFVCTAADAYSVSSALTCAVFGDSDVVDLVDTVAVRVEQATLPAVFGPYATERGWEVMYALSLR
ncbi:hypothetical protein HQ346_06870 [Rhodococcus sp. BP-252]|uniref:hypothetical protein n=1 Tax=Nocardiaceae TaxID=85025 RepID=UPI000A4FDE89|nr:MULTISPECIES: hypothetical protein [Rhodococcus]MBY6412147.1 hypothetical protein [Rhodococcus sp. BP-320]MBY6416727.1 hypothetical protein [Rhodococcus sp. BP-321]MBY6421084.1 hypothetical protein [Rhodococcus sp. BP-324]MBY6426751.1 hypothetical protein [Rhodococcus sp. BP-323]MBY6431750.1 hypothetical protein [Rhodococcus sp. BP-322]